MEPTSAVSGAAAYQALMADKSNNQQKVDGANALRLVEAARVVPQGNGKRPMPADATISIRV